MNKIIKTKLTPEAAKLYAEMSGFPNDGNVEVHTWDSATQKKIDAIMEDLLLPLSQQSETSL